MSQLPLDSRQVHGSCEASSRPTERHIVAVI